MKVDLPIELETGEDGWVVAICPVVPGCLTQAPTEDEAMARLDEALELCMALREEEGWDLDAYAGEDEVGPDLTFVLPEPPISGATCIQALEALGFRKIAKMGDHVRLRASGYGPVVVPLDDRLGAATVRAIRRAGDVRDDEFHNILLDLIGT